MVIDVMIRKLATGGAAAALALSISAIVLGADAARVAYGPDTVVDTDAMTPFVEPAIAADAFDARTLIGAAESGSFSSPPGVFVSHDGGYSWHASPVLLRGGSQLGDVQLATAPNGTFYYAVLGSQGNVNGIQFFSSTNRGDWFAHTAFIQNHRGHGFDHEQLTVDTSRGRYRGSIYMSVLYAKRLVPQLNACGLLRSSDGGHTFQGPVQVIDGWCFNSRPVVLSDGTVVFPFDMAGKVGASGAPDEHIRALDVDVALSHDGGKTFGAPRKIGTYTWPGLAATRQRTARGETNFDGDPIPQFTAGISPVTHRDAIYGAWSDMRTGNSRLLFTKSDDEGRHWTAPRPILTTADSRDAQYQVTLAVNGEGALGIAYLQYSHATGVVTEMFTDSTDGGATFSQPVAIQSNPASLGFPPSSTYNPIFSDLPATSFKGDVMVGFTNPALRFPSGGDYVDMAVDRNGAFHPIWSDARTGVPQIWTASVAAGAPPAVPGNLAASDVTADVQLEAGTVAWDRARHVLSIPVRLHNVGTRPLYPPFTITVLHLANPFMPASYVERPEPSLVNADNGRRGVGATFTYSARTLGNLGVLAPGAETAPRTWKIVMSGQDPGIVVRIDGYEAR
jgi:hypothetical protein